MRRALARLAAAGRMRWAGGGWRCSCSARSWLACTWRWPSRPTTRACRSWPAGHAAVVPRAAGAELAQRRAHPVWDFVFGGLNYQIEHHLFPTMPRVHFWRARAMVKTVLPAQGLPYVEMGAFASYRLVHLRIAAGERQGYSRMAVNRGRW